MSVHGSRAAVLHAQHNTVTTLRDFFFLLFPSVPWYLETNNGASWPGGNGKWDGDGFLLSMLKMFSVVRELNVLQPKREYEASPLKWDRDEYSSRTRDQDEADKAPLTLPIPCEGRSVLPVLPGMVPREKRRHPQSRFFVVVVVVVACLVGETRSHSAEQGQASVEWQTTANNLAPCLAYIEASYPS